MRVLSKGEPEILSDLPRDIRQSKAFLENYPIGIGDIAKQLIGRYREIVFLYFPAPVLSIFVF